MNSNNSQAAASNGGRPLGNQPGLSGWLLKGLNKMPGNQKTIEAHCLYQAEYIADMAMSYGLDTPTGERLIVETESWVEAAEQVAFGDNNNV